ncbi:MAG: hypothetical protein IJ225_06370 [Solobacterium sp.]|nr:hypothetical protein [Solobacterium sp.]
MYKINDVVVYRRDVCRVTGKKKSDFTGEMCYVLVPYHNTDNSVTMQVPVSNKAGHLRDLVTKEQIDELIRNAPGIETLESKPANMKSQYATLMKGDSLEDLVCIIKTSYLRNDERMKNHKKLASIDSEYLQKAENLLYTELSIALDMSYEESKEYFEKEVDKASKKTTKKKAS